MMKMSVNIIKITLLLTGWAFVSMAFADNKPPLDKSPTVKIVAPREGESVHGKISVTAVVSDPKAIDFVDFYFQEPGAKDRYGWQDYEPPYFWGGDKQMLDTTLFNDGPASVAAFPSHMDSSWHKDTNRVHFTIDNGKPKIKFLKPKDGAEIAVAESVTLKIAATDPKGNNKTPGIVVVYVYLDGGLYDKLTKKPFEAKLSTCLLTPGPHSVRAVAEDTEGLHNADTITINLNPKASCLIMSE